MGLTTGDTFAQGWIEAWNRRDLESLLSHYAEDVEFRSPLVVRLLGEPFTSGTVRGRQNLRDYFAKALSPFPGELGVELLGVYRGVDSVVVHFQARGRRAAEVMEVNSEGIFRRALAHVEAG